MALWLALSRFLSAVRIALSAVTRSKLRAALTILGILIGVAAVVTVTALASGARASVSGQIQALGSNALIVFPRSARSSGARSATGSRLSERDCEALATQAASIAEVAPFLRANGRVVFEGENATPQILGTRLPYFSVRSWKLTDGELWTPSSEAVSERVVVLGSATAKTLFGTQDPVGRTVRIGVYPYRVLGVLEEKGPSPFGQSQDEVVLMPITTMRSHVVSSRRGEVNAIMFSATSAESTERAKKQAEDLLRQRHKIRQGDDDDFQVRSQAEFKAMQDAVYGAISLLLVGVAAISLVVGGIGVMNIMLVSVTERTREIGIRMAIGARENDILVQFLVEALVLATLGGIAGTLVGLGAIAAFREFLGWEMRLEPAALALALGTSTTVGLVFGFFPARRAARLDPVRALQRE
jgi:putative ABC transport system permease protein